MDTRRDFLKKASILSAGTGMFNILPAAIQKALAIDPATGTTYLDAEHVVLLMQENRSFDHMFGTLKGVRGYNDPRAINLPDKNPVWLQSDNKGNTYAPFRLDIKDTKATWMSYLPHTWPNQVDARNDGKHDKWLDSKRSSHPEYADIPLTLGYYNREDIPFYYALADAFTVCDQNFCSSLTGTTANRLFFWTGTIREQQNETCPANVWNDDTDYEKPASWKTFPERLEENGISWKIYQNKVSFFYDGKNEEEDAWLGNFGDNAMGYFTQYNTRLIPDYIDMLPEIAASIQTHIKTQQEKLQTATGETAEQIKKQIEKLENSLAENQAAQKLYTKEAYAQLSAKEKSLHEKAFTNNEKDPFSNELESLKYNDGETEHELKIPKGDILHQFREDVKNGTLPTVSWLAAPENFSDHPISPWYGSWFISEVMNILTQDPELWKKTIFIINYDENDGYFDHVPPFTAPHPHKPETGFTSNGINTGVDYVISAEQQSSKSKDMRESPIGLGYRVPMMIISPWSRGGWVCSQVFDHTSPIQFLEKFLLHKTGKEIIETNISQWRRTVCGDLTAAFREYKGEKITMPVAPEKDQFIEDIHKAQFKSLPSNYKNLSKEDIQLIVDDIHASPYMPVQEKGIRSSCALPYELYVDGKLSEDKRSFEIKFKAGDKNFGVRSAGAPFNVYAPGIYLNEPVITWAYAVTAGDTIKDSWSIIDFENSNYHLRVYGPNGFFREFKGDANDPLIDISCECQYSKINFKKHSGNILLKIKNIDVHTHMIEITDHSYKTAAQKILLPSITEKVVVLDLDKNYNWYDFSIKIKGKDLFEKRYAGRVETSYPTKTDPVMGNIL